MDPDTEKPIVFIDGYCVLCNKLADLILRKDSKRKMLIATLQGKTFQRLKVKLEDQRVPDSVVFYSQGEFYFRSAAVLRIMRMMPFPYKLAKVFCIVPGPLSDLGYNWLAGRRYGIFGRRTECRIPTAEESTRFLD